MSPLVIRTPAEEAVLDRWYQRVRLAEEAAGNDPAADGYTLALVACRTRTLAALEEHIGEAANSLGFGHPPKSYAAKKKGALQFALKWLREEAAAEALKGRPHG